MNKKETMKRKEKARKRLSNQIDRTDHRYQVQQLLLVKSRKKTCW